MPNRPSTNTNILNMTRHGFYGKFGSGGNVEVSYIQSVMDYDFLDEITLIEDIKGSDQWDVRDLFQRNVDRTRVNKDIIPFLKDKSSTKFFAPLVLVLLPVDGEKVQNELVKAISKESDNDESIKHNIGDFVQFEEWKDNPAFSSVHWNREKTKLVAVDGQHRVTAMKTILNDERRDPIVDQMKIPILLVGFSQSQTDDDSTHIPSILDEVRKTFVYINNKSQKINESRAILLDNEDINSIATQEIVQNAHDNDKDGNEQFEGIPLSIYDWRGEEINGRAVPGPASIFSVKEIKNWFFHYLLGDKDNEKNIWSKIIPRLDLDQTDSFIRAEDISGLNHEYSEIARQSLNEVMNPAIIYVLENLKPWNDYIKSIRDVQKQTIDDMQAYGRYAYKWICFGRSPTPNQIDEDEVKTAYDKMAGNLGTLKETSPTLLVKDIGVRAIWSSYSEIYELKNESGERPIWIEFSEWYVGIANQVINDGWFIGVNETPKIKKEYKEMLKWIVYDNVDEIINYRLDKSPKAFGAFMTLLILMKNDDQELLYLGWDRVIDNLKATVRSGFLKEAKEEMETDFVGTPAEIKDERTKRVNEKLANWEKKMARFFKVS